MTAHRLNRRLAILRGKRQSSFDPDQYYLEAAPRARVARRIRVLLRRGSPVVLVTPRWTQTRQFLDDLATDLLVGTPAVECRTLSLAPLEGRTPHQAWNWLVQAVTEFCLLVGESGAAWRMASRQGFRHTLKTLFERAEEGPRRCLMIHGLEHMHVEALRDLIEVFEDHLHHREGPGRFNLLLAGSIDAPHFEFAGLTRLVLADPSEVEAVETLVEHLGPKDAGRLRDLVDVVGGIPAVLDVFGTDASASIGGVIADRSSVWRALGNLALELRRAWELVSTDDTAGDRLLELAATSESLPSRPSDEALVRAGLVVTERGSTRIRARMLADLTQLE
jgi:hypothetical protein